VPLSVSRVPSFLAGPVEVLQRPACFAVTPWRRAEPACQRLLMLFEAMAELEATAARLAALKMTAAEKTALARLHENSFSPVDADDRVGYEVVSRSFHELIHLGLENLRKPRPHEAHARECSRDRRERSDVSTQPMNPFNIGQSRAERPSRKAEAPRRPCGAPVRGGLVTQAFLGMRARLSKKAPKTTWPVREPLSHYSA
jgi:FCD domain